MQYLGAVHLHSTYSYDGKLTLRELREVLRLHNVSFACVTEHTDTLTKEQAEKFVLECATLSDDTFLFIPGFEVSFQDTHILMFGCETFLTQHATDRELIEWKSKASLAVLAHPHRNGYRTNHIPDGVLDGIEIWNTQYDGKYVPRNGACGLFGRLRRKNTNLFAYAGWDLHRDEHAGGPVISVEIPTLGHSAILEALKSGAYEMRSPEVTVGSTGELKKGNRLRTVLASSVTVSLIRMGKVVNRVLSWFGIRLPASLVASVRRRF